MDPLMVLVDSHHLYQRTMLHRGLDILLGVVFDRAILMGTKVGLALKILYKFQMGQLQDQGSNLRIGAIHLG
jgi:hypothetical protein